jgi:hypothetical protein
MPTEAVRQRPRRGAMTAATIRGMVASQARQAVLHMMSDASEACSQRHASKGYRFRNWVRGQLGDALGRDRDKTAATVGIAVASGAVALGLAIGTAGVGAAVLVGIAAGFFAIKKLWEIGRAVRQNANRRNKDWLARVDQLGQKTERDKAESLAADASDAIRRATDHFRKARDRIVEMKRMADAMAADPSGTQLGSCDEAVNLAIAKTRVIHETRKTENYLLPCLDLAIYCMRTHYDLAQAWNTELPQYLGALENTMGEPGHACAELCYGSTSPGAYVPRSRPSPFGPVVAGHADLEVPKAAVGDHPADEAFGVLTGLRQIFEECLTDETVHRPSRPVDQPLFPGTDQRLRHLYDAVYRKVEVHGFFIRLGRSLKNHYTRTTRREKTVFAVSHVAEVLSVPVAAIGGTDVAVGRAASAGLRYGFQGGRGVVTIGALAAGDRDTGDVRHTRGRLDLHHHTDAELKATAADSAELTRKVATHLHQAMEAAKAVRDAMTAGRPGDCSAAYELAGVMAEFRYQMGKTALHLEKYAGHLMSLSAYTLALVNDERAIWSAGHHVVRGWVGAGEHEVCHGHGQCCYGPLTPGAPAGAAAATGGLRRQPVIIFDRPHKPLA